MFIIDFDDTLFDTRPKFIEARFAAVATLGVTREQYDIARNGLNKNGNYTTRRHAYEIAKFDFDEEKVCLALDSVLDSEKLRSFLFADASYFLESLKKLEQPLVLLSLGDEEFQACKVQGAGIEKYFDRIFYVNDTKKHVVRELLRAISDAKVWFVNDRVEQTKELAEMFPRLVPVLKQSARDSEEDYKLSGIPYFKTLTEIYDYIKAQS
ncbi:MAG: HAD hydrolase-like protein [Candidatus Magasanikbacteria bacterium]|nr:HAD hydrolase-like protein [Candidatus Magasanikbacteria bacterium]